MELKNLKWHIWTLAALPETNAPVVSCYLALEKGRVRKSDAFEEHSWPLRRVTSKQERRNLEDALRPIAAYLACELLPDAKGVAVFSRAGSVPFFLPLQFRVPLPNWIVMDSTPNIYHLVELKDNYHRYVVLISTKESAHIVEVNLGAVTKQLWEERPELRKRVGRGWTKMHFQKHDRERGRTFIKEKIKILEQIILSGGYTHLILAGHPTMTSRIRNELPKHLQAKLIDRVPSPGGKSASSIVEATINSFIEAEEKESKTMAELLSQEVHTGGLAVAEATACIRALRRGQVDTLVLLKRYSPGRGCACSACEFINLEGERPSACPECGGTEFNNFDIKEELVRLAEQERCMIETVSNSDVLKLLGGVGCLLRYRLPEEHA